MGDDIFENGDSSIYGPGKNHNITVAPLEYGAFKSYFVSSEHNEVTSSQILFFAFVNVLNFTIGCRTLFVFRPSKASSCMIIVVLLAFYTSYFVITLPLFQQAPATFTFAAHVSSKPKSNLCSTFCVFFTFNFFEMFLAIIYFRSILPTFYKAETTLLMRFVLRSVLHSCFVLVGIEVSWRLSWYLQSKFSVSPNDTLLMVVPIIAAVSIYGRLMQGSARSMGESVMYEVLGTFSELVICDTLLRGRTPIEDNIQIVRSASRSLRNSFTTGTATGAKVKPAEPAPRPVEMKSRDCARARFCVCVTLVISISECSSMFASAAYWGLIRASPGMPGSGPIPGGVPPQTCPQVIWVLASRSFSASSRKSC
ncbi:hypothetical protein TrRE_jg3402 [Triparma retinervis]|uniref:Uncharacterized protein n=1 Tax=Triparma retinervis TaxID=2557542 RepID=A0A9W7E2V6_9STRA|nr:hypothetical protein TrRE_jg3402 [Triparma retinervis]